MKRILTIAVSALFAWGGWGAEPRVTVAVKDVGEPVISYGPAVGMMKSSPRVMQGVKEGESYKFDIPDGADTIYFVRLSFKYPDEYYQSMSFFLAPGERADISGRMTDVLFDYDIEGPAAFEEWVRHRRATYIQYENELADMGYAPGDVDLQTPQIDAIFGKIREARLGYMKTHPDSDLSALYLITGLATEENYALLSDSVKRGKYGPVLDYWMGLIREAEQMGDGN